MEFRFSIIITIAILGLSTLKSQTNTANLPHPTVEYFKVEYKTTLPPDTNKYAPFTIFAVPIARVGVKSGANISKIHFKIFDVETDSLLYSASHSVNSSALITNSGIKLFQNNDSTIYLSDGVIKSLKPYAYKIQTEDSLQNLSPLFYKIQ